MKSDFIGLQKSDSRSDFIPISNHTKFHVRSQMKFDLKNGKKRRRKRDPLKNNHPEKDKIRGTLVRLLWRAAAPGLKPLRLPYAQP